MIEYGLFLKNIPDAGIDCLSGLYKFEILTVAALISSSVALYSWRRHIWCWSRSCYAGFRARSADVSIWVWEGCAGNWWSIFTMKWWGIEKLSSTIIKCQSNYTHQKIFQPLFHFRQQTYYIFQNNSSLWHYRIASIKYRAILTICKKSTYICNAVRGAEH